MRGIHWIGALLAGLLAAPAAAQKPSADAALRELSRIVGTRSSSIFCHPGGESERLNSVGVDWVWDARRRVIAVFEDTGAPDRDGYLFIAGALSPELGVARGQCAGITMWRVQISCAEPCKIRFRQSGKGSAADALARHGGNAPDDTGFYFGLIEEADARRVAALVGQIIAAAGPRR